MLFLHQLAFKLVCRMMLASFLTAGGENLSQIVVSPTPVPVELPSPLPFVVTPEPQLTSTQTRTPTPVGPVLLEAISEANVRAEPDPEAERLGTIRSGDIYPIIGRYYRWLQFQYDQTRTGWVFDELVKIIGDETLIRDFTQNTTPTADTVSLNATETALGVLFPNEGTPVLPVFTTQDLSQPFAPTLLNGREPLPTFTFPPNIVFAPTNPLVSGEGLSPDDTSEQNDQAQLPTSISPIVPILALGGIGIAGLFISTSLRRK
jgi:hypothetical protein